MHAGVLGGKDLEHVPTILLAARHTLRHGGIVSNYHLILEICASWIPYINQGPRGPIYLQGSGIILLWTRDMAVFQKNLHMSERVYVQTLLPLVHLEI